MNFKEVIACTAEKCGENQNRIRLILATFLDVVKDEVADGNAVKIPHFGEFSQKIYEPRKITSPFIDGSKQIPARHMIKFKVSKNFKDQVQDRI